MRLFLVPVSKHRTLIYCQRLKVSSAERESYANRISAKAAQTWLQWEKSETGWKKKVTNYGNKALQRIAFEEWGLKSIPPLTAKRKEEYSTGKRTEVLFPTSRIQAGKVGEILKQLGTERQALHRRLMWWSIGGMPISAPVALIPM